MLTCANCGEQNPERARFCLNCGASLAVEPRRGARKVVTVVVCDVSGSTALGERLDPESLGRVMARYFERTRAVLERHHGLVQKFIGDAVVATFGVPVVREDDALRAVRAAAAMQDAVAELDVKGPAIEVRIGVATGEVMVEEAGGDPLVIGEAVNVATRLQAAAGPGEVLLDRRTWHLARDALVAAEVAGGAWRLVDVSPDALGHARRSDNPLVGRLAELQLFDWMFERTVRTSTCHLLTVLGPAGVGKSRLVAAAVDALDAAATVLYGQCSPDAEGSSFWPVAEIVRRAAEIKTADSPDQAEAKLVELMTEGPPVDRDHEAGQALWKRAQDRDVVTHGEVERPGDCGRADHGNQNARNAFAAPKQQDHGQRTCPEDKSRPVRPSCQYRAADRP